MKESLEKSTREENSALRSDELLWKRLARPMLIVVALVGLLALPTFLFQAKAVDEQTVAESTALPVWESPVPSTPEAVRLMDGPELRLPDASLATEGERGRVKIVNGTVVADNNYLLRGEHLIFADNSAPDTPSGWLDRMYDYSYWTALKDDFHLNTVRMMMMRPPQNWGTLGENCFYPAYRCYNLDHVLSNGKTVLQVMDDIVDIAGQMGMYIIIDYHPVGGYNQADATAWWNVVAPRYKDRTHVLYEATNEPVMWFPSSYGSEAIAYEQDMYELIRGHAPNTHIILWSFANATGPMLSKVQQGTRINYGKASVAYHPYSYDESAVLALRSQYPVINSEIGSDRLFKTQEAENIGVSWIWLNGAKTHGVAQDGLDPSQVFWPKDPGTSTAPPPTSTPAPGGGTSTIYVSSASGGTVSGIRFADEDILEYDSTTGNWALYLDGSDVGLGGSGYRDIDAFHILDNGSILFSILGASTIPDVGKVDDSDIIRFKPTSLGSNSAGRFIMYFDGSDVGLTTAGEDVDAVTLLADGDILLSTVGSGVVPGLSFKDEDVIKFSPSSLRDDTSGTWSMYFDGSDVGLHNASSEDTSGISLDGGAGPIFFTAKGNFAVSGAKGGQEDIFQCNPITLGANTSCTFQFVWDGSAAGFGGEAVDGISVSGVDGGISPPPSTPAAPTTTPVPPGSTPAANNWTDIDIGVIGIPGSSSTSDDAITVVASGIDIWNTTDHFHYVYQPFDGNGEIIARVVSQTNSDPWAKAGVMIRESLASTSRHASILLTPANGLRMQWRAATSGSSADASGGSGGAPVWLRIVRSGDQFDAYRSADGVNWGSSFASQTVSMGQNVFVGLAVTSHNNGLTTEVVFSDVQVTSGLVGYSSGSSK